MLKLCIEGEEEIGSENLHQILQEKKELFAADFVVISDSGMVQENQPTILYGLKGSTGFEINSEWSESGSPFWYVWWCGSKSNYGTIAYS